jgi:ferredoxin--NADP+ reductase/benzoate/toluate 1,2-dioxygenase reductase subunit
MKHRIQSIRHLTDSVFVLRLERGQLEFRAGQHITVGIPTDVDVREYSVYSSPRDSFIEILVKRVSYGSVSPRLAALRAGEAVEVDGPFGSFTIPVEESGAGEFLFVATGTGIAPYRSFVGAYDGLNYRILHGVRYSDELYAREVFEPSRHVPCVSRDSGIGFSGRVTTYLRDNPVSSATRCYLCGNCDMIYEAFGILRGFDVPAESIHAEVYF